MRLTAAHSAGPDPFEGDLTVHLHGLPPDAVVRSARVKLVPAVPLDEDEEPFTYRLLPGDAEGHGFTVTSGAGYAEVDLHARRTLRHVAGSWDQGTTLQADAGGLFLKIAADGTIAGPDDEELILDMGESAGVQDTVESDVPGVTVSRFRLSALRGAPGVDEVTIRSVATNVSVRAGSLPPFWTRVGELAAEVTTPDFAAILQEALRTAEVVNGSTRVALTVHSDALCRLDVECEVEYERSQSALPAGLPEATFAFDHGSLATGSPAPLSVELPVGAIVTPGATAGRLTGAFESSRVLAGALGAVSPPFFVKIAPGRSQAHPLEAAADERISGLDLLLRAAPAGASLDLTLVSDADGKPWDQPLLARPVNVRVTRAPSGTATWIGAALPADVRLDAGRRYWVVLQCLDGEAEWGCESGPSEAPGLHTSIDEGLSWRPSAAVGADGPLVAFVRLRKVPETFEMPVRLEVGEPSRIDVAHLGTPRVAGAAKLVALDRFAPLGRLELDLNLPELGAALDGTATEALPAACPAVEHLSNGDFRTWVTEEEELLDSSPVERPEHWELTAGQVSHREVAVLGSFDERTGLSQVTAVSGGCRYELTVLTAGEPAKGVDAAVELLWTGGAEVRTDTLTVRAAVGEELERTAAIAVEGTEVVVARRDPVTLAGLDVVAPDDATGVEVRFVVPQRAFLLVRAVSLRANAGRLSNAALFTTAEEDVPAGWESTPEGAVETSAVGEWGT
ncbi:MAG: hypothetical protein M3217_08050, partial [Actinomycetota bacterium]|nr:hypothetical protein [Actinomycetota bacterium]